MMAIGCVDLSEISEVGLCVSEARMDIRFFLKFGGKCSEFIAKKW